MKNLIVIVLLLGVGAGVIFVGYKMYKRQGRINYNSSLATSENGYKGNTTSTGGSVSSNSVTLDITSHTDGETVNTTSITIEGKMFPLAEVSVNETDAKADKDGNFSATIGLDEGENVITVVANDANGKYVEKELTITLDSGV